MGQLAIHALSGAHIPLILNACTNWEELAPYGAPYWRPRSAAELRRKVADSSGPNPASAYSFVIYDGEQIVGECSLHGIDWRNRVASVGVCIWNMNDRHSGYGHFGAQQMVDWAFGHLGLLRIEAWINEGNDPSMRLFAKLGFMHEATLRSRYIYAGVRQDMHVFGLTASE